MERRKYIKLETHLQKFKYGFIDKNLNVELTKI